MSLGIRSGVNWMRLKSSASDCASECTIKVLASPGTPFEDAVAAGEDGDQQLLDDLVLADDLPGDLLADLVVGRVAARRVRRDRAHRSWSLKIASPSLALENREKLERKLQDDHGDRGAVDLADAVAVPRAVGACMASNWSRAAGEVLVPVLVAGHVEPLGGVEVRVEGVAAALVPPLAGAELVPDVFQAVGRRSAPSNWPAL